MRRLVPLLALLTPTVATAGPPSSPTAQCEAATDSAEKLAHLPRRLLGAIAEVESGHPDDAGKGGRWRPVLRHQAGSDRRRSRVASAGGAVNRRRLHAGQPDAPPRRFRIARSGIRSHRQYALCCPLPQVTIRNEQKLVAGYRGLPLPETG